MNWPYIGEKEGVGDKKNILEKVKESELGTQRERYGSKNGKVNYSKPQKTKRETTLPKEYIVTRPSLLFWIILTES